MLRTELLRVKALIGTTVAARRRCSCPSTSVDPDAVEQLWHGNLKPADLYAILVPVRPVRTVGAWQSSAGIWRLDRDLPVIRRYIGALIETSMPTVALALHIDSMGRWQALGFVAPLIYFIFIILSTLRLDFWLSTFTGFVAAAELFCMAMFYHPAGQRRCRSRSLLSRCAQHDRADLRHAGRRRRDAVAPAVRGQHHRRPPRATASPTCSASTSRRRWSSG